MRYNVVISAAWILCACLLAPWSSAGVAAVPADEAGAGAGEGGGARALEVGGPELQSVSLSLERGQRALSLGKRHLFEGTLSLEVDGAALVRGRDFLVDCATGTVLLRRTFPNGANLVARFRCLPFEVDEVYSPPQVGEGARREGAAGGAPEGPDPGGGQRGVTRNLRGADRDEGAGTALTVGGSKRLSFELGSGRDLTVSQSLDLDITGKVGSDVEVKAVLSDRNLPVLPDGNTQTLEELDEVFVKVTSPSLGATFGDYTLSGPPSQFGRFSRTVEGVEASAHMGGQAVKVATASPRGRFSSMELLGEEGKQGPYYVLESGEGQATIVPGSEKVWLDGELLRRGAAADYTVDYAAGTVTFTSARPITKDSRITVDYEHSTDVYKRSLHTVMASSSAGPLELSASYVLERDDGNSAAAGGISDEQKSELARIGDSYTEEAPPDTSSGEEAALPPRPPSSHEVVDVAVSFAPSEALSFETEIGVSDLDLNTFSGLDDSDNKGTAYSLRARLSPRGLSVGGRALGAFEMSASHRSMESSFATMGRTDPALDYYKWNLPAEALGGGERRSELSMSYRPWGGMAVGADLGRLSLDGGASSRLAGVSSSIGGPRGYLVKWERAETEGALSEGGASRRDRGLARLRWAFGPVAPRFEVEKERLRDGGGENGSDYTVVGGGVKTSISAVSAGASVSVRDDYALTDGARSRETSAVTQSYGLSYRDGPTLGLDGRYSLRAVSVDSTGARLNTYVAFFDGTGRGLKGALGWRGTYEVTSTDEGPRTVVFVGPGKGHYDSGGRYVGIGDYELSDEAGDGRLSSRVTLSFSSEMDWGRAVRPGDPAALDKVMSAIRWSGQYRIEEHTREAVASPSRILRPGSYMNPDDVIRGNSLLRQDIEIFPRAALLTPRLRYEVRNRLQNPTGNAASGTRLRIMSIKLRSRALSRTTLHAEQVWGRSSSLGSSDAEGETLLRRTSETRTSVVFRPGAAALLSLGSSYLTDRTRTGAEGARWEIEPSARFSRPGVASLEAGCKWARASRGNSRSYDQLLGWLGDRVEYNLSGQVGLGRGLTLVATLRATGIEWSDLSHYMKMEMRALF